MGEILIAAGDDPQILELVKRIADPSLTKGEVRAETRGRGKLKKVAPGVFLLNRGSGMSSKWLYYRKN